MMYDNYMSVQYKSKQERQQDVTNIIKELAHFQLTPQYEPIQRLYQLFKNYVNTGEYIKINIQFPMINRRIKGELLPSKNEKSHVRLVHEQF